MSDGLQRLRVVVNCAHHQEAGSKCLLSRNRKAFGLLRGRCKGLALLLEPCLDQRKRLETQPCVEIVANE